VFNRLPRIPCTPRLALINATPTKVRVFVQAGSSRAFDMLGWPAFQNAIAAAIVNSAWMNVPVMSHRRLCAPTLSPIRPTKAPKLNEMSEHSACWSALWKDISRKPGEPSKRRQRAMASCGMLSAACQLRLECEANAPGQSYPFGIHTRRKSQRRR
jgi:hypothetical protein